MEAVNVSQKVYKQLNQFTSMVWGNAQAALKPTDSPGVEYIDLAGYLDGLRWLFGRAIEHDKILVRAEYRSAFQELQTTYYSRGAFVTGQPGIGKRRTTLARVVFESEIFATRKDTLPCLFTIAASGAETSGCSAVRGQTLCTVSQSRSSYFPLCRRLRTIR